MLSKPSTALHELLLAMEKQPGWRRPTWGDLCEVIREATGEQLDNEHSPIEIGRDR